MYKRILLKLSGEALQGDKGFGIEPTVLDRMVADIKELLKLDVQIGIVIGGGNLFRGAKLAAAGMNRVVGDHIAMLATMMNGLAVRDSFHRSGVNATLMSTLNIENICETYNWSEAIRLLRSGRVVIFGGGTGNPFFTTDTAAVLRGIEIEADVIVKATKVDGVYTADPVKDPQAKLIPNLSYDEVLEKEYSVMDLTAFVLARDHKMPIMVCNINKPGALLRVVQGETEGTIIKE